MLVRLSLVSLLAAVAAAVPASDATTSLVERSSGGAMAMAFPANLARRFTSTVGLLRSRSGPKGVSGAKRSISDELVAMVKGLNRRANASPSASAAAGPSQTHAPSGPSASPSQLTAKLAAKRSFDYVKQKIAETPWEVLDSSLLCPAGEQACPIFPRMGTFECVQTDNALESCGGCVSRGQGEDCTAIKGALGVGCARGQCKVFSCAPGYKLDESANSGNGRCRRQRK